MSEMRDLLIIADDLTGACDAASYIARTGKKVSVVMDADAESFASDTEETLVFNTQSRILDRHSARLKVSASISRVINDFGLNKNNSCIIKKIDTAFRGNVGIEIEALMDGFGVFTAFLVNAIPSMNRITYDGYQFIDNKKIADTGFALDPLNPVMKSYIPEIIAETSGMEAEVIRLEYTRSGVLSKTIENHLHTGKRIFLFDAVTKEDIKSIVDQLYEFSQDHIWVGSLGLIEEITGKVCNAPNECSDYKAFKEYVRDGIIVGVSGSTNIKIREQLDAAKAKKILEVIDVECSTFISSDDNDVLSNSMQKRIDTVLKDGKFVFLVPETVKNTGNDVGKLDVSNRIILQLSSAIQSILRALPVRCIVLVGGETSYGILKQLGAKSLNICKSIETAIIEGHVAGGDIDKTRFIIKGGSIGKAETMINIYDYIEKGVSE